MAQYIFMATWFLIMYGVAISLAVMAYSIVGPLVGIGSGIVFTIFFISAALALR